MKISLLGLVLFPVLAISFSSCDLGGSTLVSTKSINGSGTASTTSANPGSTSLPTSLPTNLPSVLPSALPTSLPTPTPTATSSSTPIANASAYNIGINAPGITYYNNSPIYSDVTYQMCGNDGPWDTSNGGDNAAPLDSTGAPTVAAWAGFTSDYPSGVYTLSWDGTGSMSISNATMGNKVVTQVNGVQHNVVPVTFTQNPSTPTATNWTYVSATPPLTNIHMMAPGSQQVAGSIFMTDYLAKMAPFSTVRFMDQLLSNGSPLENWSQRTWPAEGSRCGKIQGVAYEDIIAFANQAKKDIWINVPVLASDDYVCRMARLFLYGEPGDKSNTACNLTAPSSAPSGSVALNSNSKIYLEFSNEIWNWGFQQTEDIYCMTNGQVDIINSGCTASGYPSNPSAGLWCKTCDDGANGAPALAPTSAIARAALANSALPWGTTYAKATQMDLILTKRNNDVFKGVFGSRSSQIKTVMNVQSAWAAEVDPGFAFMKTAYGSVTASVDYMAVAPYFNIDNNNYADNLDDIFGDLGNVLKQNTPVSGGLSIYQWILGDLAEANQYGLPLIAYEGGEGLSPGANSAASVLTNDIAAQDDPRMYTIVQQYFAVWDKLVGRDHLFNYYEFAGGDGIWGMFGTRINGADPGSQKWDALMSLILVPGDASMDGSVDQADCAIVRANFGKSGMFWSQGDFNHDGVVNAADLAILNQHITGAQCVAP